MTNKEAINELQERLDLARDYQHYTGVDRYGDALELAIKALQQADQIQPEDLKYIRRYGMTRKAIHETIIRVQQYAIGLLDTVESFLGKAGTDYGDGLDMLNDIKDECDCPHDKKLFVPYMTNATLFMHLISGRTSWGGHTSAYEACADCDLYPDKFGLRTSEDVNNEDPEECDPDPDDDHIDSDIQAAEMAAEDMEDNEELPFC